MAASVRRRAARMRRDRGTSMMTVAELPAPNTEPIGPEQTQSETSNASEIDCWVYRTRTIAILRHYAHTSIEIGRLPPLLGREFFRSRITSYSTTTFEAAVVFVTDMERSLEKLTEFDRKVL